MTTPTFNLYPAAFGIGPPPGFLTRNDFQQHILNLIRSSLATSGQKLLLETMLLEGPSASGEMNIAWTIYSLNDPSNEIGSLVDCFIEAIIIPVLAVGGKTPTAPTPFFDDSLVPVTPTARRHQAIRNVCIQRENYTCPVTDHVHRDAPDDIINKIPKDQRGNLLLGGLTAAHIIPFSMNDFNAADTDKAQTRAIFWNALTMFCGQSLESLRGEGINEPDNIIICESEIHRLQGRLQLAFEEVQGEQDTYTVATYGKKASRLRIDGRRVVFHDYSNKNVKLPNPLYLKLHAALCKAMHASGRAEELICILDELNEEAPAVLAANGDSAALLKMAMYRSLGGDSAER